MFEDNLDGDSVLMLKLLGEQRLHFLRKICGFQMQHVRAHDLWEFTVPEIAEVASGKNHFETAIKECRKANR